jgi:lipopolysaccharide export system ATP-binding protein
MTKVANKTLDLFTDQANDPRQGLRVEALTKSYRGRKVVNGVSLSLRRGEILGLLGPNGAGKTTSFYMITGLVPNDSGKIYLDGQDVSNLPMYRRARIGIGYLPQEASIFKTLSVAENIMAILEVTEADPFQRQARLDDLLAEFDITHLSDVKGAMLSGGERRRAEIASDPQILWLDEPFAGIDPIAVEDIRALIKRLKDRGIGVLITDHNVRETLSIVDRAVIMHDGSVLVDGDPQDILANEQVRKYYLGADFKI